MSTKDTKVLDQQRQRRNRINRMKNGIVLTIAVWMIVSLLAIIFLSVQVVNLNRQVDRLTAGQNEAVVPDATERSDNTEATGADTQQEAEKTVSQNTVQTGIDSPDNMAKEGDTHKVYLTFDGSPGTNTDKILDVLKEKNVKATFFVAGDDSEEMKAVYQRIADEGHTLGMHSYSNKYSTIYASTDAFKQDLDKISGYLDQVTGTKSLYYRFPGGSSNEISNVDMAEFVRILNDDGITYFDWNVSAGDTAQDYTTEDVVKNVTEGVVRYKTSVVLLHDGENKSATVEALGPLIDALQKMNAEILPIDENTDVIQYIKADSVE
ncbi:MAG: polysaccharide deacetylase [Lachnospiraceae bacterium]|nr:polysaccharide deacetylase [Lachnospiraceae bacterium]